MSEHQEFKKKCADEIYLQGQDDELRSLSKNWVIRAAKHNYSYHFEWLGRPIIQHPQDMIGVQQLLWDVQPDLIIETGIARGGSLIFYSSILELISICGGSTNSAVLGIDIDIRHHNYESIINHPLSKRVNMIQGSSTSEMTYNRVLEFCKNYKKILVCLDSNHTYEHVLKELELYAPLVSSGSYCIVFDTIVDDMPSEMFINRPWGADNNPKQAVHDYIKIINEKSITGLDGSVLKYTIDKNIENQLLITVAPDGFLRRL